MRRVAPLLLRACVGSSALSGISGTERRFADDGAPRPIGDVAAAYREWLRSR